MKILFVTPYLPSPARFGGQRRLEGLMRELAKRHEVSVVAFNNADEYEHESVIETQRYCREVRTVANFEPSESSRKRKLQLLSLASLHSYEHGLAARRADFQRALDEMTASTKYDVIQVEFAQMAPFRLQSGPDRPLLVLDEHNVEYDVLKRTAKAAAGLFRGVYNSLNWRKLAREERAAWLCFDGVALTSARDQALLYEDFPTCRSEVIPNGVDVAQFAQANGAVDPGTLLFFGAINYFPNADGVTYFVDEVMPKVRERCPSAIFRVLGPGSGPEVLARQGNGVEVLGKVDDVNPHIDRAAAVVVPLRIGGGTRLKIVEALSKGKAVISTRLGAEGIDVVDEEHLLLADTPEQFATQIQRVLASPDLARRLGQAGRKLMEARYSWQSITANLERFYAHLQASPRRF